MMTIRIDVYVNYQGTLKRTFSYTVPVNQEELEDPDYMFDDCENKTGFSNACELINSQITQFFVGRELPLAKKTFD